MYNSPDSKESRNETEKKSPEKLLKNDGMELVKFW